MARPRRTAPAPPPSPADLEPVTGDLDAVDAVWSAPYPAQLPDGTVLVPGETVAQVGADEARDSAHWTPCAPVPPRAVPAEQPGVVEPAEPEQPEPVQPESGGDDAPDAPDAGEPEGGDDAPEES